jgi:hypothetical protein
VSAEDCGLTPPSFETPATQAPQDEGFCGLSCFLGRKKN